jgi:hypothetical protein
MTQETQPIAGLNIKTAQDLAESTVVQHWVRITCENIQSQIKALEDKGEHTVNIQREGPPTISHDLLGEMQLDTLRVWNDAESGQSGVLALWLGHNNRFAEVTLQRFNKNPTNIGEYPLEEQSTGFGLREADDHFVPVEYLRGKVVNTNISAQAMLNNATNGVYEGFIVGNSIGFRRPHDTSFYTNNGTNRLAAISEVLQKHQAMSSEAEQLGNVVTHASNIYGEEVISVTNPSHPNIVISYIAAHRRKEAVVVIQTSNEIPVADVADCILAETANKNIIGIQGALNVSGVIERPGKEILAHLVLVEGDLETDIEQQVTAILAQYRQAFLSEQIAD